MSVYMLNYLLLTRHFFGTPCMYKLDIMNFPGSMMSAVKCDFCKDKGDEGFLLPKLPTVIG